MSTQAARRSHAEPPLEQTYRARVQILEAKMHAHEDRIRYYRRWIRVMGVAVVCFGIAVGCVIWIMWSDISSRDATRDEINQEFHDQACLILASIPENAKRYVVSLSHQYPDCPFAPGATRAHRHHGH